ncbi:cold shock domain-containing protein [Methylotenera sp.]|uniref:cold shock domain-containing protein n=1 Tax=Methylotenera sp. TaxID=2051956 RepID=UPI002489CF24|nr:cold shock domain-containing protein [Methylotenera sp.]MDI1362449.1 cold shock domain-containing protein [Methylotenera sp.]
MRQQGKIFKWVDSKGYGFISADGSAEQVFVHISAFPKGLTRPVIGEVVTFEVAKDASKGLQAYNVLYLNRVVHAQPRVKAKIVKREKNYSVIIIVLLMVFCSLPLYQFYKRVSRVDSGLQKTTEYTNSIEAAKEVKPKPFLLNTENSSHNISINSNHFQCTGKSRCNEMTSCDEAMFYLSHCPGTITDGDGDGIPCEDQWCGH